MMSDGGLILTARYRMLFLYNNLCCLVPNACMLKLWLNLMLNCPPAIVENSLIADPIVKPVELPAVAHEAP